MSRICCLIVSLPAAAVSEYSLSAEAYKCVIFGDVCSSSDASDCNTDDFVLNDDLSVSKLASLSSRGLRQALVSL